MIFDSNSAWSEPTPVLGSSKVGCRPILAHGDVSVCSFEEAMCAIRNLSQRLAVLESERKVVVNISSLTPLKENVQKKRRLLPSQSKDESAEVGSAASRVFEQPELLELILRHMALPALRMLKATNRRIASSTRDMLMAPSWLVANSGKNLHDIRRLFASRRDFKLPMRVVIERLCPKTGTWTYKLGTLLRIRAKKYGDRKHGRTLQPVEIGLEVDGEGLHENPTRLLSHGCCLYTRVQPWELSIHEASITEEDNMGLGLIRPVLPEMVESCRALNEHPIVGLTVAELLLDGDLKGAKS